MRIAAASSAWLILQPSCLIFLISFSNSWHTLSTAAFSFLLNSSLGFILISRSLSCFFSVLLYRATNAGVLSVEIVIFPGCRTAVDSCISPCLSSTAYSLSNSIAVLKVEK